LLGEMTSGQTQTIHLTVHVGLALGEREVLNTAHVQSETFDPVAANDSSTAPLKTGPAADLALSKTGPASVVSASQISWTLLATNNGPSTAHEVTVIDPLPAGASYLSASPSQGTCTYEAGTLTCHLGTLADGTSAQITLTATAAMASGELKNTASASALEPDPEPANNSDSASTVVTAPPAATPAASASGSPNPAGGVEPSKAALTRTHVTLRKLVHERSVTPGGLLHYRLIVGDAGRAAALQSSVCDLLAQQTSVVRSGGGRLAQGRICFEVSSLAPGHTRTFAIVLRVDPGAHGRILNRATVSGANFAEVRTHVSTALGRAAVAPFRENRVTG
jgi:uncharacterized repeat protein (TIGR01451 family)